MSLLHISCICTYARTHLFALQGCVFDIFRARCGAASATDVTYCASDDATCAACPVTASKPVCFGADGRCVCPSLCSVAKSPRSVCRGEVVNARLWLTFAGFALLLPLMLFVQRKWNERGGVQHMRYNRRLRRQQQLRERQRDTSRDLELSRWRDHREQYKLEVETFELKSCYWLLEDASGTVVATAGVASATETASETASETTEETTLSTDPLGAPMDALYDQQGDDSACAETELAAAGDRTSPPAMSADAVNVECGDDEESTSEDKDDDKSSSVVVVVDER